MTRGVVYATVGNLFPPMVALVTAPILAQMLGVAGRGEVAAATAPLTFAIGAVTFGIPEALTYFVARGTRGFGRIAKLGLLSLLVVGILATIVVAAVSSSLAAGDEQLARLIVVATLVLPLGLLLGGLRGIAAGVQAWRLVAFERLIGAGFRLVLICVLALAGALNPTSAVLSIAISNIAGLVVYVRIRQVAQQRKNAELHADSKTVALYGLSIWSGALTGIMLSRLDQLLIVPLAGVEVLGIYAVAVSISEVVLVFNAAVRDVAYSRESADRNVERLALSARISTMITVVGALGVGILSVPLIPLLFGAGFSPAIVPTEILLLGAVVGNPGSVAGAGLAAAGRPHLRSLSLLAALIASTMVLILFSPQFGAIGAAVATTVGNAVAAAGNLLWSQNTLGVRPAAFLGWRKTDFIVAARSFRTR